MKNKYYDEIEKRIISGEFKSEADLMKFLKNIEEMANQDPHLKRELQKYELFKRDQLVQKDFYEMFLKIYREHFPSMAIDLTDVSEVKKDGENYIKYKDADDTYKIISAGDKDKDYREQIKDAQEEYSYLQTGTGEENKNATLKKMAEVRKEYEFENVQDVNKQNIDAESRAAIKDVKNYSAFQDRDMLYNEETRLFMDKDSGENYYVAVTSDGQRELRKVEEEYYDTTQIAGTEEKTSDEIPTEIPEEKMDEINNMSLFELEYALSNKDQLSEDMYRAVMAAYEKKKSENEETNTLRELEQKPKVFVLTRKMDGFSSYVLLVTILSCYSFGLLFYLLMMIK